MGDAAKHILAIHAHPDDIEFQCAGTLLLLKERGCTITVATMTPGDCGSAEMDAETIARVRRDEAKRDHGLAYMAPVARSRAASADAGRIRWYRHVGTPRTDGGTLRRHPPPDPFPPARRPRSLVRVRDLREPVP
jgi:Uncharacterized proteins, LmbE homologs